jgi:signal transduction histidine kinase
MPNKDPTQDIVLVVDDSRTMRLLLRKALEDSGFIVHEAENGEQAIELFSKIRPHVVLLDVEMQGMDGFTTCSQLRVLPEGGHVPILITTSHDDTVSINRAYEAGATDFQTKPVNWNLLGHRVRYLTRTGHDYLELQHSKFDLMKVQEQLQELNMQLEQRIEEATQQLKKAQKKLIASAKMNLLANLITGITQKVNIPLDICTETLHQFEESLEQITVAFNSNSLKKQNLEFFLQKVNKAVPLLQLNLQLSLQLIKSFKQIVVDQVTESRQKFILKDCLDEVFLHLQPAFQKHHINLVMHCPNDITVDSYPGTLSQIITILTMNSIVHGFEHTEAGTITIHVSVDSEQVTLSFSDNGKGIPTHHLENIFDIFFTTKQTEGYAGLGLYIAKNQITQIMDGNIQCESIEDHGATFILTFPLTVHFVHD